MLNPGVYNLGQQAIAAALTDQVITVGPGNDPFIKNLQGILAANLWCDFVYGTGGTTCVVIVETSLDQGVTWIPIARFDFTTANGRKICNLSGLLSKAVTAVAALSVEGVNDGVLGDMTRAKVTSTGTYAGNTSVSVRLQAR
jgi:hypothetical protein